MFNDSPSGLPLRPAGWRRSKAHILLMSLSITLVASVIFAVVGAPRSARAGSVTLTYPYATYTSGTTWTVPGGVTSITITVRGAAGGTGGTDGAGNVATSSGPVGNVVATYTVVAGDVIGIYPGQKGGNGSNAVSGTGGGVGGKDSYSADNYNGGTGGNAGSSGTSGGGGGGGAASLVTRTTAGVTTVIMVAGGGGGGGGNCNSLNAAASGKSADNARGTLYGGNGTNRGGTDGGGGGGGGGGTNGGSGGGLITCGSNSGERAGDGGNGGGNSIAGSPTSSTNGTTSSTTNGLVTIAYSTPSPTTPDLTAATDLGSSNTDDITTWTSSAKPQFTGTAAGGSVIDLGVNDNYSTSCGNADASTGVYTCNWTPSSDGTYTITVRSTVSGVTDTSGSLTVTIDTARPTATWSATPTTPRTSRSMSYTLGFNESVSGLASGDFSNAGTASCSFAPSASSGTSVTVSVTCSNDGTVIATLASASVTDVAGNTGPATNAVATTVVVDSTAPEPTLTSATLNNTGSATVRSSEPGTAYLVRTSVTVTNVASITDSDGDLWNSISISGGQVNTALLLSLSGLTDGTYKLYTVDSLGNLSAASTNSVIVDNTAPGATWSVVPESPSNSRTLTFTLTTTESITGLSSGDFTNDGTATGCSFSVSSSSGSSFTVTVSCTSDGTVVATLNSGTVADVASNSGPSSDELASSVTINSEVQVSYEPKGGSSVPSGVVQVGGSIPSSPGTPSRLGYTFGGWSATDGGSAVTFPYAHGKTTDFTMYARWTANTLTVIFDSRGGTAIDDGTTTTGSNVSAPATPTRTGYSFNGWFTASTGGTEVSFPYTHGRTSNFTLYAQWTAQSFTVTFKNGLVTAGTVETIAGASIPKSDAPADPTKPGYAFEGWSTSSSNGWPVTFPYNHGKTSAFTLYALWRSDNEPNNVWFYPAAGRAGMLALVLSNDFLTPEFPRSTTTYSVSTTITMPNGVDLLDTVTMCWYKSDANENAEPGVSDSCENAADSPETELEVVWTRSTNRFTRTGSSNHALGPTGSAPTTDYESGSTTMTIDFKFRISNAMQAGDWTVVVRATDILGVTQRQSATAQVAFFGSLVTGRTSQNFGVLPAAGVRSINDFLAGEYTTNANAKFTIKASTFTCDGCTPLTLVTDGSEPGPGEVALDCSIGSTLQNPIRVTGSDKDIDEPIAASGEALKDDKKMSCRLKYGGGASRALVQYSSTITFGIGRR